MSTVGDLPISIIMENLDAQRLAVLQKWVAGEWMYTQPPPTIHPRICYIFSNPSHMYILIGSMAYMLRLPETRKLFQCTQRKQNGKLSNVNSNPFVNHLYVLTYLFPFIMCERFILTTKTRTAVKGCYFHPLYKRNLHCRLKLSVFNFRDGWARCVPVLVRCFRETIFLNIFV